MKKWNFGLAASIAVVAFQASVGAQEQVEKRIILRTTTESVASEDGDEKSSKPQVLVITSEDGGVTEVQGGDEGSDEKRVEVRIESSAAGTAEGGQPPKVVTRGKVVVVGPDGEKKEYDVSGEEGHAILMKLKDGEDALATVEGVVARSDEAEDATANVEMTEEERIVIGVQCEEPGEVLRRHLKLGTTGIVIVDVREETPAAEAGLQKDDILVSIDEKPVSTKEELVEIVSQSDGKALNLDVIRDGEHQKITVTPRKMKVPVVVATAISNSDSLEGLPEHVRQMLKEHRPGVRMQRVHPGIIIDGEMPTRPEDMQGMIDRLRKNAEDQAVRAAERARGEASRASSEKEEFHKAMTEMREQMKAMQDELQKLRAEFGEKKAE